MKLGTAKQLILKHLPDFHIDQISKIGEGTGNVAFKVNSDMIFRFPKDEHSVERLRNEVSILRYIHNIVPIPVPDFQYVSDYYSFVGYPMLTGVQLLNLHETFSSWKELYKKIGEFLSVLHSVPVQDTHDLNVKVDDRDTQSYIDICTQFYAKTKTYIPEKYHSSIVAFIEAPVSSYSFEPVLCHSDLGIEHILISDNHVSGIIDWGGVALSDPSHDFARLYRDLGEDALDGVLKNYTVSSDSSSRHRERAIFYGKCLIFEDIYYGITHDDYMKKSLRALDWMF